MNDLPATPPAHVRLSLEQRVTAMEAQRAEDYRAMRELTDSVREFMEQTKSSHLALIATIGDLAKAIKEAL